MFAFDRFPGFRTQSWFDELNLLPTAPEFESAGRSKMMLGLLYTWPLGMMIK